MAIVIVGAGGHAREVHDVVEALSLDFVGFLADGEVDLALLEGRGPFLGPVSSVGTVPNDASYVIGIGDGEVRARLDDYLGRQASAAQPLVHPSALVGRHRVLIGPGSVLCAGVQVTTDVTIGRHVHLNRGVQVGHDCVLGDFVTAHPAAVLSGRVVAGGAVTLGTGSHVLPRVTLGDGCVVGAGSVVLRDVAPHAVVGGVPARSLRP